MKPIHYILICCLLGLYLESCRGSHCQCYTETYTNGVETDVEYFTEDDDNGCEIYNETTSSTSGANTISTVTFCSYN